MRVFTILHQDKFMCFLNGKPNLVALGELLTSLIPDRPACPNCAFASPIAITLGRCSFPGSFRPRPQLQHSALHNRYFTDTGRVLGSSHGQAHDLVCRLSRLRPRCREVAAGCTINVFRQFRSNNSKSRLTIPQETVKKQGYSGPFPEVADHNDLRHNEETVSHVLSVLFAADASIILALPPPMSWHCLVLAYETRSTGITCIKYCYTPELQIEVRQSNPYYWECFKGIYELGNKQTDINSNLKRRSQLIFVYFKC